MKLDDEILSVSAVADPYGYLGRLRAVEPVYWNAKYRSWVLTVMRMCRWR